MTLHTVNNKYAHKVGAALVYLLLCALYFVPLPAPAKLCYPVAWLAVASLGSRTWWLTLALCFSALGDLLGVKGELLAQIGAFGVAQVCYIIQLSRQSNLRTAATKSIVGAALLPAILLATALIITLPQVGTTILKIGVVVYGATIGTMVFFATLFGSLLSKVGAVMFMLSDFVLAISLFTTPHPTAHLIYLPLYWLGQGLMWWGITLRGRK